MSTILTPLNNFICPVCGLSIDRTNFNIHVRTKYNETTFGFFVENDSNASIYFIRIAKWLNRILGGNSYFCFSELENTDVLIQGSTMLHDKPFKWKRVSSAVVFIQILKDESLFNILLDPLLME